MKDFEEIEIKKFYTIFEDHKNYNGLDFKILRLLNNNEKDEEVGDMYKIKFEDGLEIDAYPEEIFEQYYFQDVNGNRLN